MQHPRYEDVVVPMGAMADTREDTREEFDGFPNHAVWTYDHFSRNVYSLYRRRTTLLVDLGMQSPDEMWTLNGYTLKPDLAKHIWRTVFVPVQRYVNDEDLYEGPLQDVTRPKDKEFLVRGLIREWLREREMAGHEHDT